MNSEYSILNWSEAKFGIKLINIKTIGDGSCFFHSIINSFLGSSAGLFTEFEREQRKHMIRTFRDDLADSLKYHYDKLSRGFNS